MASVSETGADVLRKQGTYLFPAVITYYNEPLPIQKAEGHHMWDFDGKVRHQRWYVDEDGEVLLSQEEGRLKFTPPWLWGVTDQTAPTMPAWMKDDAKWQAALDAQK